MHVSISNVDYLSTEKNQNPEIFNEFKAIVEQEEAEPVQAYDYFIPGHVSSLPIKPAIKYFYAFIRNLCNGNRQKKWKGSTWVRNSFIAQQMEVTDRCIQKWLKSLSDHGVIVIELFKDQVLGSRRRIWLSEEYMNFQKFHNHEQKFTPVRTIFHSGTNNFASHIYKDKDRKEEDRKEKSVGIAPIELSVSKPKEEKKLFGENIKLTDEEYQKLLKTDGEEKLKWKIDFLDMKIGANRGYEKKWKSHYQVLDPKNWVEEAYNKAHGFDKQSNLNAKLIMHKKLAIKVNNKWGKRGDIILSENNIEFINGPHSPSTVLTFGENGFEERLDQQLRKRQLNIKDL